MSALAQTVQSTYSKLELDTKRSVAHRRLEDSMQLRLGKITEKNASRPASSLSVNVNALHMSHTANEQKEVHLSRSDPEDSGDGFGDSAEGEGEPDSLFEDGRLVSGNSEQFDLFDETSILPTAAQRGSTSRVEAKSMHRAMSIKLQESKEDPTSILKSQMKSLEDAFYAIAAAYDLDGDGTLSDKEIVHVFQRCGFYDEKFTTSKVTNFFHTWALGCNRIIGVDATEESLADGIGYDEFEHLLKWSADVRGVSYEQAVMKVIRLSRKLCDSKSSQTRRLETLFDAISQTRDKWMTAHEFIELCAITDSYTPQRFATGDAYSIFYASPGRSDLGMCFEGFMWAVGAIGEKIGKSPEEMLAKFAGRVGTLDSDKVTITKVKYKMKHAASKSGGHVGWRSFFQDCDEDKSGFMDWDEFFIMCRVKLQMTERENHLKLLFEKLDTDDSGELTIDELIEFIEKP